MTIPEAPSTKQIAQGIVIAAVIALASATINLYARVSVLESGPRGAEVISRLAIIETELRRVTLFIDEEYAHRRSQRRAADK